jgi:hypothetical protein
MAQLYKSYEYSASITCVLPFLLEDPGFCIYYLAIRPIFDPNGAASHYFIGRKDAQEGTKECVVGILR